MTFDSDNTSYRAAEESSEDCLLTIAVPTFNRNDVLRFGLERLLPQLTSQCKLLIVDNASDIPVEETLRDLLQLYPNVSAEIIRNRLNIGGNANICRCFEYCDTRYIWVLGDDDSVLPDAVKTIFSEVSRHPNGAYLNFACELFERSHAISGVGIESLIEDLDSFSNALFTSTCVFRADIMRTVLRIGYHYAYSMAPHLAMLMMCSAEGGVDWYLSPKQIVYWTPAPQNSRWSIANQLLGAGTLLELIKDDTVRAELARKIPPPSAIERLVVQLLSDALRPSMKMHSLFVLTQAYERLLKAECGILRRLELVALRLLFIHPKTGLGLVQRAAKLLRRDDIANYISMSGLQRL